MNQDNLDYLKNSMKFFGFSDKLNESLEIKIKEQPDAFQLTLKGEFKKDNNLKNVDYVLDFKKSSTTDMYFFNRYLATLNTGNPEADKSQTFYITKGNSGVTAKEAFNLLDGRAVNKDLIGKDGQPFNAWLQLNFNEREENGNFKVKQFHSNYKFDLEAAVSKHPIKELGNEDDKTKLMKSLEKGNLQSVTYVLDGR